MPSRCCLLQQVEQFIGAAVRNGRGLSASPLPVGIQYLYPDTADYYYRYGDGYLYQVDRTDNLIAALIPLLAGGYLPGQYLPAATWIATCRLITA